MRGLAWRPICEDSADRATLVVAEVQYRDCRWDSFSRTRHVSSAYGKEFARLEASFQDDSRRRTDSASSPGLARLFHRNMLVGNETCVACPATAREPAANEDSLPAAYQGILSAAR